MTLAEAIAHANRAYAGMTDKAGEPYLGHAIRVMERVLGAGDGPPGVSGVELEDLLVVALLHDVWEDTDYELGGLSIGQLGGMQAISKEPREEYADYAQRALAHPVAGPVKVADLEDNLDPERLAKLEPVERERLVRKYLPHLFRASLSRFVGDPAGVGTLAAVRAEAKERGRRFALDAGLDPDGVEVDARWRYRCPEEGCFFSAEAEGVRCFEHDLELVRTEIRVSLEVGPRA